MTLTKNPNKLVNGKPECYGNYEPDHYVCDQACNYQVYCAVETREEEKRVDSRAVRELNGKRKCFGELYSSYSQECNYYCNDAYDCQEMKELKEGHTKMYFPPTARRSSELNVIQNNRPVAYRSNSFENRPNTPARIIDDSTKSYVRKKYGVGLDPDPVIPGQFEGEEWWIRLFKEVAKYAGHYALQLLSQVLINSWWAPNIEKKNEPTIQTSPFE